MDSEAAELTEKAKQTRQRILDTALNLFATKGYEATTMRDIASGAKCSLGLAYRYFAHKEEFVLAMYRQMAGETSAQLAALPKGSMAERFYRLMLARLKQATAYRDAFRALFSATMNPNSGVDIMSDRAAGARNEARQAFVDLVKGSTDMPTSPMDERLATLLYSAHFGLILFWLYDRSPD